MSPVPREGQRMGSHPSPRRGHFITGTPLCTGPRRRALPGTPAPALSLSVSTTGESSTVSFVTFKDIQSTSSQLSVRWLTALHGEKDKFIWSLNLSDFSLQLLNDFMLFPFFFSFSFFFYKINEVPAISLLPMQVRTDGDQIPSQPPLAYTK